MFALSARFDATLVALLLSELMIAFGNAPVVKQRTSGHTGGTNGLLSTLQSVVLARSARRLNSLYPADDTVRCAWMRLKT
jgi:hypothetical protein